MYGIEELIALAAEKRASDVHLIAGLPPKCRIDGRIETLTDGGLTREDCEEYGRQLAGNAADQILVHNSRQNNVVDHHGDADRLGNIFIIVENIIL